MGRHRLEFIRGVFGVFTLVFIVSGGTSILLDHSSTVKFSSSFIGLVLGLSVILDKNIRIRLSNWKLVLVSFSVFYVPNKLLELLQLGTVVLKIPAYAFILALLAAGYILFHLLLVRMDRKDKP